MLKEFTDVELESELVALRRRKAFTYRAVTLAEEMLQEADAENTACVNRLTFIEGELQARYEAAAAGAPLLDAATAGIGLAQKTEDFVRLQESAEKL